MLEMCLSNVSSLLFCCCSRDLRLCSSVESILLSLLVPKISTLNIYDILRLVLMLSCRFPGGLLRPVRAGLRIPRNAVRTWRFPVATNFSSPAAIAGIWDVSIAFPSRRNLRHVGRYSSWNGDGLSQTPFW
ncbi:hypothetical protein CI102_1271 [Trichoderma harzianum]|nr:hypothetical protein CI102_1271 [Trichoderma harzianum]